MLLKYRQLIFILQLIFYAYRFWHFYESNKTFIGEIKESKIYKNIQYIHKYTTNVKECSHVQFKQPYLLRLYKLIMTNENIELYTSIYKITKCIHDPEILTNKLMELIYFNKSLNLQNYNTFEISSNAKGLHKLYKMTKDFEYFSKKLLLSNIISISEYNDIVHENNIRKSTHKTNVTNNDDFLIHFIY